LTFFSRQTFDNFIVGATNQAAYLAAVEAGKNPGLRYNPLFIYGGTGAGKSHLLRAIAGKLEEGGAPVEICVESYLAFSRRLLESNGESQVDRWRAHATRFDAILLDDCRSDAAWIPFQNEMVDLIDRFVQEGKPLVLTSIHSPYDLQPVEERFLSRLRRGLIVSIGRPDRAMKRTMISHLIGRSAAEISDEALDYLADIPVADARELQGIVNRILIASEAEKASLSRPWLVKTLRGLIRSGEVRMERIVPVEEPLFEAFIPEEERFRPVKVSEAAPEATAAAPEAVSAAPVGGIGGPLPVSDGEGLTEEDFEVVSVTGEETGGEELESEARSLRPDIGESEGLILDWDREIDRLLNDL